MQSPIAGVPRGREMAANLVAILLAWAGVGLAFVTAPSLNRAERLRLAIVWAATATLFFVVQNFMIVLLATFLLYFSIAPASPAGRLGFFLVAVPCLPVYAVAPVDFPGINYLIEITPYKVAVAAILLPLLLMPREKADGPVPISPAEICIIIYALLTAGVLTSIVNITTGLRFFADQLLNVVLPYVALRRYVRSQDDLDTCLKAFVAVSLVLAGIALVATSRQWDFYRFYEPISALIGPDRRTGFTRIGATINVHSLGYHLAAALLILEYLKYRLDIRFKWLMILRVLLAAGIYFTDSRGAMVGLVVGYILMFALHMRVSLVLLSVGALSAAAGGAWLLVADVSTIDAYGTFAYRQDLFMTSLAHIQENFLFGDYLFRSDRRFRHLIQGQHIIDVTNLYLQIALYYGVPALILLLVPSFAAIGSSTKLVTVEPSVAKARLARGKSCFLFMRRDEVRATSTVKAVPAARSDGLDSAQAALAGSVAGWLVLVATTSDVGLTLHLGLVLSALCSAAARAQPVSSAAAPQTKRAPRHLPLRQTGWVR